MITRLIWPERRTKDSIYKDFFWVGCTAAELQKNILPLISEQDFLKQVEINKGSSKIPEYENEKEYEYFFLISIDSAEILSFPWFFPYAGMWNAMNPFEPIGEHHFEKLSDLKKIRESIKKK